MRLSYEMQMWDGPVLRSGDPKPMTPRLYRYLPIQYCREFVDCGRVRISRSRTLDDHSLSAGQRDEENRKSVVVHASEVTLPEPTDTRIASSVTDLGSTGRERFEVQAKLSGDYYLLCLSSDLRDDLFDEFPPADAVVEIFNVSRFAKAMRRAGSRKFGGRGAKVWMIHQPVRYLGEVLGYGRAMLTVSPFFDKHTDFKHQKEHRFAWYPCIFDDGHLVPRLRPDGLDCQGNPQRGSGVGRSGRSDRRLPGRSKMLRTPRWRDEDVTGEVKRYYPPGVREG